MATVLQLAGMLPQASHHPEATPPGSECWRLRGAG